MRDIETVPGLQVVGIDQHGLITLPDVAARVGRSDESRWLPPTGTRGPGGLDIHVDIASVVVPGRRGERDMAIVSGEARLREIGYYIRMTQQVHVPYTVEQDETGWFCAHATLPGGGAHGEGMTRDEAIADLREALIGWFEEFDVPDELTLAVDVA